MYGGKARVVIHPMVEQSGTPTEMRSQIETLIRATYEDLTSGA
jgi:hypothetical protein